MKLVIVESPTKAKKIGKILGSGYSVKASVGHIRDLPISNDDRARVLPPDFKMHYEVRPERMRDIASLKELAEKADAVILATDPDREGEAIAWHLKVVLNLSDPPRVTYNEITEAAIKAAFAAPRPINMRLVMAREVRRALDRIIGWEVSSPLSRDLGKRASAGRVQVPALRLLVERERELRAFSSKNFFTVLAHFPDKWVAKWESGVEYFDDEAFAKRLAEAIPGLTFTVVKAARKEARESPDPPFITTTLQAEGSKLLGIGVDQVMALAQSLYQNGHITYHRTDSPNLSEEGETMLRREALARGFVLSEKPRRWNAKEGSQEAHEAIRPTHAEHDDAGETEEEKQLYNLIWRKAIASQMADARYEVTSATLDAGQFEGRPLVFKASGRKLVDEGWKTLYRVPEDDEDEGKKTENEAKNPVPPLNEGEMLTAIKGSAKAGKTTPPRRYTQATLIKMLEKLGIGRPSTYATIIKTLLSKEYMVEKSRSLVPTPLGEEIIDAVIAYRFKFAEYAYTKDVEQSLDDIVHQKSSAKVILQTVWDDLQENLGQIRQHSEAACPLCQSQALRLFSKKTDRFFWKCQAESCGKIFRDVEGTIGSQILPPNSDGPPCPECGEKTSALRTKNQKLYFRCGHGHGIWWPDPTGGRIGTPWKISGDKQAGKH